MSARSDIERACMVGALAYPGLVEESQVVVTNFVSAAFRKIWEAAPGAPKLESGRVDVTRLPALIGVGLDEILPLVPWPENEAQAREAWGALASRVRAEDLRRELEKLADLDPHARGADAHLVGEMERLIRDAKPAIEGYSPTPLDELGYRAADAEAEIMAGTREPRLSLGLFPLEGWIGGWGPGEVTTLAGEANTTKSAIAMHLARQVAKMGKHALFFSCEMTEGQVGDRELWAARSEPLHSTPWTGPELIRAQRELHGGDWRKRVLVITRPRLAMDQVLAICRRQAAGGGGLGFVCFDHLGRWDTRQGPKASEFERMTEAIIQAKITAQLLHVPILMLTHLNRSRSEHSSPNLTMLRGSGKIEDESDNALLLWRENLPSGEALLCRVGKTRQGPGRGKVARMDMLTDASFDCTHVEPKQKRGAQ